MKQEKQQQFEDLRPNAAQVKQALGQNRHPISLLLDGIQDPRNLGLLFRLADAARLQEILLWNIPKTEPGSKAQRIARSTTNYVPYRHIEDETDIEQLSQNYLLTALEFTNKSIPYTDFKPDFPIVLILGNEISGVSEFLLEKVQTSIHLPMYGMNTSMNVACAASIASYALIDYSIKNQNRFEQS